MKRREFLGKSGLVLGSTMLPTKEITALQAGGANAAQQTGVVMNDVHPPTNSPHLASPPLIEKTRASNYALFQKREAQFAVPADFVIGLSEEALNKFLGAHYTNNPDFYDRGRSKGKPVYQVDFDDHGTKRSFKFFAKILKDSGKPALTIKLLDSADAAANARFAAWWRLQHGASAISANASLPPNVELDVGHAQLQVNFPKLNPTAPGDENQLDFDFSIKVAAFMSLTEDMSKTKILKLTDWDIQVTPVTDPLDPNSSAWGQLKPGCEQDLLALRQKLRDLFTVGANIALTELSKTLTRTIPLPPIDVVNGIAISPRELFIGDRSIAVSASLVQSSAAQMVSQQFEQEINTFNQALEGTDLNAVLASAPLTSHQEFDQYLQDKVAAYRVLSVRGQNLVQRNVRANAAQTSAPPVPKNDFFVMLAGSVFDKIAKNLLHSDVKDCTGWLTVDIIAGYARGRACYWFSLRNAAGSLSNTTISVGCDFAAGAGLELQACIRIPCAPDQCATWTPGVGLKGPVTLQVTVDNSGWQDNKALLLTGHFTNFPGFEIYGLPPVVGDIANAIVNFVTSVALKAFFNAILSLVHIYVVSVPKKIDAANVTLKLHDLGVSNVSQMLVLTGTTDFS